MTRNAPAALLSAFPAAALVVPPLRLVRPAAGVAAPDPARDGQGDKWFRRRRRLVRLGPDRRRRGGRGRRPGGGAAHATPPIAPKRPPAFPRRLPAKPWSRGRGLRRRRRRAGGAAGAEARPPWRGSAGRRRTVEMAVPGRERSVVVLPERRTPLLLTRLWRPRAGAPFPRCARDDVKDRRPDAPPQRL